MNKCSTPHRLAQTALQIGVPLCLDGAFFLLLRNVVFLEGLL